MIKARLPLVVMLAALALAGSLLVGGPAGSERSAQAHPGSGFVEVSIDALPDTDGTPCSPIDSAVNIALPLATYSVDICIENRTGSGTDVGALDFKVNHPEIADLDAVTGGVDCDSNPNFDQVSMGGGFSCSPPAALDDDGTNPPGESSSLTAYGGASPLPVNAVKRMASITYSVSATPGDSEAFSLVQVHVYDSSFNEIISCNPLNMTPGICHGATVTFVTPSPKSGFKLAFASDRDGNGELYTMNADGTGQTRITNNAAADQRPAWSADGTKIAFDSDRDGNLEVYSMNADGSGQTNLTGNATSDLSPDWSPDGTELVFQSSRDGNNEIYVMNANGSGQTRLTNNAASDAVPAWSPDGTKILFDSTRDGNSEVYVMNADGTGQTRLTNNSADDGTAAWSPDGTKIAFHSNRDGNYEIYVMNANGSSQTRLTTDGAADFHPTWKAGGEQIAFETFRDGPAEIYSMNADGSSQTRLTNDSTNDVAPHWRRVSGAHPADFDGDGCPDSSPDASPSAGLQPGGESWPDQTKGGLRNPQNPYDYFNPSQDGQNRVDDILLVVNEYFVDDPDVNPPAGVGPEDADPTSLTDRTLPDAAFNWRTGPPNGHQRVDDILNIVKQYFHDCS